MIDLTQRSLQKELMDENNIPFAAIVQTLRELNVVNTTLGGHAITVEGVKQLMHADRLISICEIGCGGGDNLFALHKFFVRRGILSRFVGVDINPECIAFAQKRYAEINCEWKCSDYVAVDFSRHPPDIIFCSLFCHHFTDAQLIQMLQWLNKNSRVGFFINDLHRHWLAYYFIKLLTKFFSKSHLVKNDAAISVARSFRRKEWNSLFQKAGLSKYTIHWKWAFRWLVISRKYHVVEE
jgi:2-polyprenyl-3-methyl-5-hydroxy-6-metoxy-1,4-benzoquinol methylase